MNVCDEIFQWKKCETLLLEWWLMPWLVIVVSVFSRFVCLPFKKSLLSFIHLRTQGVVMLGICQFSTGKRACVGGWTPLFLRATCRISNISRRGKSRILPWITNKSGRIGRKRTNRASHSFSWTSRGGIGVTFALHPLLLPAPHCRRKWKDAPKDKER